MRDLTENPVDSPDAPSGCDDCSNCSGHRHSLPEKQNPGCLEGWALGMASACVFLIPAAGCLLGAVAGGPSHNTTFLFGVVGLFAGACVAWVITKLIRGFGHGGVR